MPHGSPLDPKTSPNDLAGQNQAPSMEKSKNHVISKPKSRQLGNDRPQTRNSAKKTQTLAHEMPHGSQIDSQTTPNDLQGQNQAPFL